MNYQKKLLFSLLILVLILSACNLPSSGGTIIPPTVGAPINPEATVATPTPGSEQPQPQPTVEQQTTQHPQEGVNFVSLDQKLASFVPNTVTGLSFILARDGQVLFSKGYGDMAIDAVAALGAATSVPSALAILTLVDQGVLKLDEPVATYLQGKIDWPADKATITMRMLLNHTSGLSSNPDCVVKKSPLTMQACVQEIARQAIDFTPGTQFEYGVGDYQVAGYVAEVLSGKPWTEFFAERIATPLGLTKFTYVGAKSPDTIKTNPHIAIGGACDVADYNAILQMVLAGGKVGDKQILSPQIIAEFQKDQIAGLTRVHDPWKGEFTGYSFGWWFTDPKMHVGSPGPELSSQGTFGTTPWIDFGLRYSAVILVKSRIKEGTLIWNVVRPVIITQMSKTP